MCKLNLHMGNNAAYDNNCLPASIPLAIACHACGLNLFRTRSTSKQTFDHGINESVLDPPCGFEPYAWLQIICPGTISKFHIKHRRKVFRRVGMDWNQSRHSHCDLQTDHDTSSFQPHVWLGIVRSNMVWNHCFIRSDDVPGHQHIYTYSYSISIALTDFM